MTLEFTRSGILPPDIEIGMRSIRARVSAAFDGIPGLTPAKLDTIARVVRVAFYVGALENHGLMRPSHAYRFGSTIHRHNSDQERLLYTRKQPRIVDSPWFGADREIVRKSIYTLVEEKACLIDESIPTNNSLPRYALSSEFAAIFTDTSILDWRRRVKEFRTSAGLKKLNRKRAQKKKITISLPDGTRRSMTPGPGSTLTKHVIEDFLEHHAEDAKILSIADTGDKLSRPDADTLRENTLQFSAKSVLPDVVFLDKGGARLNIVEAAATGGYFDKKRKRKVTRIANQAGFADENLRLISAFFSRDKTVAKNCFLELPAETYMWFADEPEMLLGLTTRP